MASSVYFVRIGKTIKVGFSTDVEKRMKSFLTTADCVELLFSVPGDRKLERRIHHLLAESRIARELFLPDRRVLGFIDCCNYGGLECGLKWLHDITPEARKKAREEDRLERVRFRRQTRAQENAYYASLVADRMQRLGW